VSRTDGGGDDDDDDDDDDDETLQRQQLQPSRVDVGLVGPPSSSTSIRHLKRRTHTSPSVVLFVRPTRR
jgi:hypothetical protein